MFLKKENELYKPMLMTIMAVMIGVLLVLLTAVGCQNKAESKRPERIKKTENVEIPDPIHNARNSLDYEGIYRGVMPTASGEGMEVIITLQPDGICAKKVKYIGKGDDATFDTYAAYSWNEEGNTITLEAIPAPNQYFVGENILIQLDIEGNRITGELAEHYILKKQ